MKHKLFTLLTIVALAFTMLFTSCEKDTSYRDCELDKQEQIDDVNRSFEYTFKNRTEQYEDGFITYDQLLSSTATSKEYKDSKIEEIESINCSLK